MKDSSLSYPNFNLPLPAPVPPIPPVPPLTPSNGYVAEDGTTFYVAEDGSTFYVQEN
jgi:hypothetical protein